MSTTSELGFTAEQRSALTASHKVAAILRPGDRIYVGDTVREVAARLDGASRNFGSRQGIWILYVGGSGGAYDPREKVLLAPRRGVS